jgi:hypothetical protein
MEAIEFSGKIEHGQIKLPLAYEAYNDSYVKVIVLVENPVKLPRESQKDKLRSIFQQMEATEMFSKIKDPNTWQKKQRDEWE